MLAEQTVALRWEGVHGGHRGLQVWYAVIVRSPVSIALFFLLSAFFLFALLAALQHSRKSLLVAGACLTAVVCIIIFLTPVRLPSWIPINEKEGYRRHTGAVTTTTEADSRDAPGPMTSTTISGVAP